MRSSVERVENGTFDNEINCLFDLLYLFGLIMNDYFLKNTEKYMSRIC